MQIHHIALVNSSEDNSDRFYAGLLGCDKQPSRQVPADLMKQLFNLDETAILINYVHPDGPVFEVFIIAANEHTPLSHACLTVNNRDHLLANCEKNNVSIRRFVKPDGGSIIFIADFDQNLFEIKEKS